MFVGQYVGGLVVKDDLSQEAKKASQCVDCSRHYTPVRLTLMLFCSESFNLGIKDYYSILLIIILELYPSKWD